MSEERIVQLERELAEERDKNNRLQEQIKKLQTANVTLQLQTEEEEELITNKLIKKLSQLKHEKEQLLQQVEQEEELLTNTLQQKLQRLREEKISIENQLEVDKEYITNKLQKQLDAVIQEKNAMERKVEQERSEVISQLMTSLEKIRDSFKNQHFDQQEKELIEHLTEQVEALHTAQQKFAVEKEQYRQKNAELRLELSRLESENFVLEQKIKREHEKQAQISTDVAKTEFSLEMEEERHFNALSKLPQHQNLTQSPLIARRRSIGHTSTFDRARSSSLPVTHFSEMHIPNIHHQHHPDLNRTSPRQSPRQSPRGLHVTSGHHHVNSLPTYANDVSQNPLLSTSPTKISPQAARKERSVSLLKTLQSPRERSNSNTSTGSTSASDTEEEKK